jgi:hypothetical protein
MGTIWGGNQWEQGEEKERMKEGKYYQSTLYVCMKLE